tara:strand:+ start:1289 stop:2257 length:969 start_codon:yes stop_codon:yes gene_type:complete
MKNNIYYFIIISLFLLMSCNHNESTNFNLKVKRLDAIYSADPYNTSYEDYANEYGYFWDVYSQNVIFLPSKSFADSLSSFQQEQDFAKPYKDVINQYQDFSLQHKKLSRAFYHYNLAFPNKLIPTIVTFFGGFNYVAIVTDSTLGIGLEMFLGNNNYYSNLTHKFPKYMHHQFHPEYLTSVAINGWLESEFPVAFDSFLFQMIHFGKIKYALNKFLVDAPSNIIMGFTEAQMEWCKNSEFSIWKFLIEQGLLYSKDQYLIRKYMKPAPYSKGMPRESPGQVAIWMGWNIVDEFMENNSEVTISELFQINDAQYILNQSKYKP